MTVTAARFEEGELVLSSADPAALKFAWQFQPGEYEIVKKKPKRSLDANAYFWVLLDRLCVAVKQPKTEVYRRYIRDLGGNTEHYTGSPDAIRRLAESWERNGLGWQAELYATATFGVWGVCLYYGSSSFDRATMARLIDLLIQDCRAVGIETMPPAELESLLNSWDRKEGKRETPQQQKSQGAGDHPGGAPPGL